MTGDELARMFASSPDEPLTDRVAQVIAGPGREPSDIDRAKATEILDLIDGEDTQ